MKKREDLQVLDSIEGVDNPPKIYELGEEFWTYTYCLQPASGACGRHRLALPKAAIRGCNLTPDRPVREYFNLASHQLVHKRGTAQVFK